MSKLFLITSERLITTIIAYQDCKVMLSSRYVVVHDHDMDLYLPSGESVSLGIFNVDDVETTRVTFSVSYNSDTT